MKSITLFTIPNCKWCSEVKIYFKKKKIKYHSIDLSKNAMALKDCKKHKCKGAPVKISIKSDFNPYRTKGYCIPNTNFKVTEEQV